MLNYTYILICTLRIGGRIMTMIDSDIKTKVAILESEVDSLHHQYDQLQADVSELRSDVSDVKDDIGRIQIENAKNFSDVKDLLNGVTGKALNSMPPWGVALTIPFGAIVGVVVGIILTHFM